MDSMKSKQAPLRLVPEGEVRCIWMTAGVVDYKLCDLEFNCTACPFDREMQHGFSTAAPMKRGQLPVTVQREDTKLYHPGHLWVEALERGTVSPGALVRVGIDPFLGKMIFCIKQNILPAVGAIVVHDRVAFWIVDECGTLSMRTPVSGKVHNLNRTVIDNPDVARRGDSERGWLVTLEITDGQGIDNLMNAAQAARYWKAQEARFENLARAHLEGGNRPPTLADGGAPLQSWRELLGREAYYQVLLAMLR